MQAAVRSVWVSSLNVIGGGGKKIYNGKVQTFWGQVTQNLHVNLAKMAEIVIQRISWAKPILPDGCWKQQMPVKQDWRRKARRPCFSRYAPTSSWPFIQFRGALDRHLVRHLLQHFPFLPGSKFKPRWLVPIPSYLQVWNAEGHSPLPPLVQVCVLSL